MSEKIPVYVHADVPVDVAADLLAAVEAGACAVLQLQQHVPSPRGLTLGGLSARETDVLRLAADGFDTDEIARKLCYSRRTVANIVHGVITRFNLNNRTHAVAYAIRVGLI